MPAPFRRVLILSRNEWKTAVQADMRTSKEYSNRRVYTPDARAYDFPIEFKFIYELYTISMICVTIVSKLSRLSGGKTERIVKTSQDVGFLL